MKLRTKRDRIDYCRLHNGPSVRTNFLGPKPKEISTWSTKKLYELEILATRNEGPEREVKVHYTGWSKKFDEWRLESEILETPPAAVGGPTAEFFQFSFLATVKGSNLKAEKSKGRTIYRFEDSDSAKSFSEEWWYRIINDAGDFVFIELDTFQIWLSERPCLEEYTLDGKLRLRPRGFQAVVRFVTVKGYPNTDDDSWYVKINVRMLYMLVEEHGYKYYDSHGTEQVLKAICDRKGVSYEFIGKERALSSLHSKIKNMFVKLRNMSRKGGKSKKNLLERWESEDFELNLGSLKRKYEHEIEKQRKRRKISEEKAQEARLALNELKVKERQLKNFISRLIRRKYLGRFSSKKKTYSYSWAIKRRKILLSDMKDAGAYMGDIGVKLILIIAKDEYGNQITMEWASESCSLREKESSNINIDEVLYRKDRHLISDFAYHELSLLSRQLPSLKKVRDRSLVINELFDINHLPDEKGMYEPLGKKLHRILKQLKKKEPITGEISLPAHIKIKISGDGTCIGKRYHVVNMTCSLLLANGKLSGDHVISILEISEKYCELKRALEPLAKELAELHEITVSDQTFSLEFLLVTDLKFLNTLLGLQACSAKFSCPWCKCPSDKRWDTSLNWSQTQLKDGARTIADINYLSKKKRDNFGCINEPIFQSISITEHPDHCSRKFSSTVWRMCCYCYIFASQKIKLERTNLVQTGFESSRCLLSIHVTFNLILWREGYSIFY
ncbi:hypothetical protein HOLleu_43931 [Holothuria leucospilota]|uniref:Uncharacterized protein n=1 Tax=Holothuria leucospilota TaxID=206669 RepID=A0A9Q0YD84_HOLLE|nr:hypothetical protein HOLleu_43931 [Holothuria leucospilota]